MEININLVKSKLAVNDWVLLQYLSCLNMKEVKEVPVVLGESVGPSEDRAGETDRLCPHVWAGTPARWPSPASCPAPLLSWSSLQRSAGGFHSERCLQGETTRMMAPIKSVVSFEREERFAQIYHSHY